MTDCNLKLRYIAGYLYLVDAESGKKIGHQCDGLKLEICDKYKNAVVELRFEFQFDYGEYDTENYIELDVIKSANTLTKIVNKGTNIEVFENCMTELKLVESVETFNLTYVDVTLVIDSRDLFYKESIPT